MTRTDSNVLRRVFEQFTSSVGAIALTALVLMASDARSADASIDPAAAAQSIAVRFSSDALDNSAEVTRVYKTLKRVSRQVCGFNGEKLSLADTTAAQRCAEETLAAAVKRIDRPKLTALHATGNRTVG